MEQLRALLDAWIEKYIKQEVTFREGAALPSAAINDLFNMLIAQGDDTAQTLKYACEYLLAFSDTHTARAQFIEQALAAINARMDAVDELANTATNALAELEALKITKLSIDDNSTSSVSAWSSQKVSSQLASNAKQIFNTKVINHATTKAMMVFIDDDGRSNFYDKWKPIILAHNVPITCALITGRIDTDSRYLTWAQIAELKSLGVEFISHTHTHITLDAVTEEVMRSDFELSQEALKAHGLNHEYVVYPGGHSNNLSRKIAREYFSGGIDILEGLNTPPFYTYKMMRKGWFEDGRTTVADHKAVVDEAIANNALLIWKTHSQYPEFVGEQLTAVGEVIEYAKSLGVEIVSISEAMKKQGNILDMGDLWSNNDVAIIDINGNAHGRSIGSSKFVNHTDLISNINGSITEFQKNCRTVVQIPTSDTTGLGLPRNTAGLVEVIRGTTDFFGERVYYQYQTGLKYASYWNNTTKEWSTWILINPVKYLGYNAVTPSTLPSNTLTRDVISITYIQAASATGFPENSAGELKTYALNTGGTYPHREYTIAGTNRTYKQYWDGTAWGTWELQHTSIKMTTETLNFGSVPAGGIVELNVTFTGVTTADNLICTPSNSIDANVLWFGSISTTDTVRIKLYNPTSAPIAVSQAFKLTAIKQ